MKKISVVSSAAIVVAGLFGANSVAVAQAPVAVTGCYAQGSGTVYLTGLPETPVACHGDAGNGNRPHTPFSWGAGVKGDTGAQGVQGVAGDKGDTGPQGVQGARGETGAQGLQGVVGPRGDVGPQGAQGLKGDVGIQGEKGDKGDKGDTGAQGIQGIQGVKGDKGDTGAQGVQGIQGIQGLVGLAGVLRISITANVDVANVVCPAGKVVLSGGYVAPSNGAVLVQQSYPSADDTWTVVVKNTGNARINFQAWAVCGSVNR